MAYYDKVNCNLRTRLFTDLIIENHLDFQKGSVFHSAILERPNYFDFTHIIEDMMAICSEGQYQFTDGVHADFTDGTDSKTGTLHANGSSRSAELTNVRSKDGVLKSGAIRSVVLNPILEKLHFFFIPKKAVHRMMHTRNGEHKVSRSLWLSYDIKRNKFSTIDKYGIVEFNTFKELAMEKNR